MSTKMFLCTIELTLRAFVLRPGSRPRTDYLHAKSASPVTFQNVLGTVQRGETLQVSRNLAAAGWEGLERYSHMACAEVTSTVR
eukprot:1605257-Amphidinium_carterae.3